MKTIILCFAVIPFFLRTASSQIPDIAWEKQFELKKSHYFSDVLELPGENFILLGAVEYPGDRNFDILLLECNRNGDTLRSKVFVNTGNDIPMRIIQIGNEGFVIACMNVMNEKVYQSRLMFINSDFTERWRTDAEYLSAILKTDIAFENTGIIWWLNTFFGENENPVLSLTKLDIEGKKIPDFNFDKIFLAEGYTVQILRDGSTGISSRVFPEKGKPSVQVMKIDTDGKIAWRVILPNNDKNLTPQCLCCSADNSLLIGGWAGLCYNPDAPVEDQIWDYDYLLAKVDADGNILWINTYNREGSEKGTAVAVLPDGNIMAAGKCETSFSGQIGPWLLLIDKNGKMIKDQVHKYRFVKDQVARIICTTDRGFLIVGPGYVEREPRLVGWVKKLNPVL